MANAGRMAAKAAANLAQRPQPPQQAPQPQQQPNIFNTAAGGINRAIGTAAGETAFRPMMVRAGTANPALAQAGTAEAVLANIGTGQADIANYVDKINAERVAAGQIADTDLSAYTNPYESQVVGQSLSDLDRARQMQAMQLNAQATRAGAFGGSRQALMQSELGRNYLDQAARTASGLRQAGFQNAQQLAGQDIASRMQADLANQGASLQAGTTNAQLAQQVNLANQGARNNMTQFNLGNQLQTELANQAARNNMSQFNVGNQFQASLANQAARNNMSQFNIGNQLQAALANQGATLAGSQQRLNAAGQLGSASNLGFGMGMDLQNQAMLQGALERSINQDILDAAQSQYAGMQGAPGQALNYMTGAISGSPTPVTQTKTGTPGLFDILTAASQFSDVRLKDSITKIGNLSDKIGLYSWKWNNVAKALGISGPETGVLAQEVEAVLPDAVSVAPNGFKRVRYDMVFGAFS